MKSHGDELNDNLFNQVQRCSNKDGEKDDVRPLFPISEVRVPVCVMIPHRRLKRYEDSHPPEEERKG